MRGFSLVEIAIVMVVIGLLVGAVIAGQSMIRASELAAVPQEVAKFTSATQNFKTKYGALPGDMRNATEYWGTSPNCPGTEAQSSGDKRTCNGDGNGNVGGDLSSQVERHRFWQHLSNAELIAGKFTGVRSGNNDLMVTTGLNAPASKLTNAGYSLYFTDDGTGPTYFKEDFYPHTLQIGSYNDSAIGSAGNVLSPKEAKNIDDKMDDGLPGLGKVRAKGDTACITSLAPATTRYKLTEKQETCKLQFGMDF